MPPTSTTRRPAEPQAGQASHPASLSPGVATRRSGTPAPLSAGVRAAQASAPARLPRLQPASSPPATPPLSPRDAARELLTLLRSHGLTGRPYAYTFPTVAVLSLPHVTIWISRNCLTWTRNGHTTTWPAHDTQGAADHIAHPPRRPGHRQLAG